MSGLAGVLVECPDWARSQLNAQIGHAVGCPHWLVPAVRCQDWQALRLDTRVGQGCGRLPVFTGVDV